MRPIRIFVVSTDHETGEYLAFDPDDPKRQCTAYSKDDAISRYIERYLKEDIIIIDINEKA